MPRIRSNQPLVPSVLDRLLNDEVDVVRELPASRHQVLRELKLSVRRDLENLLNTRVRCIGAPEECRELEESLVNYGIPDITGASLSTAQEREEFCRLLQAVIERYEPRFQSVSVKPLEAAGGGGPLDRTFRFRIDATLIAEPAPEPVVFDSELRPGTGGFEVKGAAG